MTATHCINLRLTEDERRYAQALGRRAPGTPRPEVGSAAHGLKFALRWYAANVDRIKLFEDVPSSKCTKGEVYTSYKR